MKFSKDPSKMCTNVALIMTGITCTHLNRKTQIKGKIVISVLLVMPKNKISYYE